MHKVNPWLTITTDRTHQTAWAQKLISVEIPGFLYSSWRHDDVDTGHPPGSYKSAHSLQVRVWPIVSEWASLLTVPYYSHPSSLFLRIISNLNLNCSFLDYPLGLLIAALLLPWITLLDYSSLYYCSYGLPSWIIHRCSTVPMDYHFGLRLCVISSFGLRMQFPFLGLTQHHNSNRLDYSLKCSQEPALSHSKQLHRCNV